MNFISHLEEEARKAAVVRTHDPERNAAFIAGARFAAQYLCRVIEVSPMEDAAGVTLFLDGLRLKDVREALSVLLTRREEADNEPR